MIALAAPAESPALDPGRALTQYVQTAWRMEEGLPHNSIRAVLQRRDGYLWLGTYGGLVRFDGVRFLVYDNASSGLRDNEIRALAEDADGTLWVGTTAGGLHRFRDGVVLPFDAGIGHRTINALAVARDGSLAVGTGGGLYRVRDGKATQVGADVIGTAAVQSLAADGDDLWVGVADGLFQVSGASVARRDWPGEPQPDVRSLHAAGKGALWVGSPNRLQRVRVPPSGALRLERTWPLPEAWAGAPATSLLVDRRGTVWVGSYGGGLYRLVGDSLDRISTEHGFLDHRPWALGEDREGHVWVGTRSGLLRLRDGAATAFSSREGLPADLMRAVYEDGDGALWIGSEAGLSRYRAGRLEHWTPRGPFRRGPVRSFLRDSSGRFWIATDDGLVEMNTRSGSFVSRLGTRDGLPADTVRLTLEDRSARVWIGTTRGVALCERALGRGRIVVPAGLEDLRSQAIEALFEDHEGGIWVGTVSDGLRRIVDGRVERPLLMAGASIGVRAFHEDEDGTLYVGTIGSGLFVRRKGGEFHRVTTRDGLVDDAIWSILPLGERLWLSSDRGVFVVERRDLLAFADGGAGRVRVVRRAGTPDGMKSRECNGGGGRAGLVARDGRVWYPTSVGAVVIDPRLLEQAPPAPAVVIEESVIDRRLAAGTPLVVPPGSRDLEIHYTGLSFLDPARIAFHYRLLGYQDAWVDAGSRRVAYFAGLRPGRYRFEAQAANAGGAWSEAASLEVRVEPRLLERPLVRLGGAALALLGLGAWLRRRADVQRRREDELARLVASRTAELADANERLARLATLDDLTGLANHRRFVAALDEEWHRAERSREPLSLLLLDVDDFKAYNDTYGHPQGDLCLQHVARAIDGAVQRTPDLAARYGGEEFVVVLPDTDEAGARAVAEGIRSAILALAVPHPGSRVRPIVTVSIGGATARPRPGMTLGPRALLGSADRELYAAKERGRDQVVIGEPKADGSESGDPT